MTENSNNWDQELTFPDTGDELEKIKRAFATEIIG